jgi:hypothetical protein
MTVLAGKERLMKTIIMVGLIVVGLGIEGANAGGLACAVSEALQHKDATLLEWTGHKFQVRPVEVTDIDKRTHTLSGKLVYKNGKRDETLSYRISKTKGAVKSIEVQINDGMWLPIAPELKAALGDFLKTGSVEQEKQGTIHQALYKAGEHAKSSWNKTAELIVAFIAIRHC